jgi:cephalosporin hydroxylase
MGDLSEKWADARAAYYQHVHIDGRGKNEPYWRGVRVVKFPSDLILYAQVIQENKPDFIIETGTAYGGSALFFRDMLSLFNPSGRVITIDVSPRSMFAGPANAVRQIVGSSIDPTVLARVRDEMEDDSKPTPKVMVVLDSDHSGHHVFKELRMYSKLVTPGQFIVVEDCYTKSERSYGPHWGVRQFLKRTKEFHLEPMEDRFIFAVTRGGWLRRV